MCYELGILKSDGLPEDGGENKEKQRSTGNMWEQSDCLCWEAKGNSPAEVSSELGLSRRKQYCDIPVTNSCEPPCGC